MTAGIGARLRRGPGRRWNAALLNLSGLSLGYCYLRRFKAGIGHLVATGVLVWILAAGAAAGNPRVWLGVAVLWLGWMAFHAWKIGDAPARPEPGSVEDIEHSLIHRISTDALDTDLLERTETPPEPPRASWTATAVGAVLLAALVVGVLTVRGAANGEFDAATAAHEAGDCVAAQGHYDRIDLRYQLSFSGVLPLARQDRERCEALIAARDTAAEGDYEATVAAYEAYLAFTDPPAEHLARTELSEAHLAQAKTLTADAAVNGDFADYSTAIGIYALLTADFGDTEAAQSAPDAVQAMYNAAIEAASTGGACAQTAVYDYFERQGWSTQGTDPEAAAALTAAVQADATARLPGAQFSCGSDAYESGDRQVAENVLTALVTNFPDDPNAAAAQEILDAISAAKEREAEEELQREQEEAERQREAEEAAAEEARLDEIREEIASASGNGDNLSDPEPNGSSGSGEVELEIGNSTDGMLEVLYTGPETGSFTVSGCSDCSTQCSDWVAVYESVSLPAGEYEVVVRAVETNAYPNYGVWDLESGGKYTSCYYLTG
jgi:hypothetical protein